MFSLRALETCQNLKPPHLLYKGKTNPCLIRRPTRARVQPQQTLLTTSDGDGDDDGDDDVAVNL